MKAQTLADLLDAFPEAEVNVCGEPIEVMVKENEEGKPIFSIIKKTVPISLEDGQM